MMTFVRLPDVKIESIGHPAAALKDDPRAQAGNILDVALDSGKVRIDQDLAAKEYARSRDGTLFSKGRLHAGLPVPGGQ
jgi:hypothetical protein